MGWKGHRRPEFGQHPRLGVITNQRWKRNDQEHRNKLACDRPIGDLSHYTI